MLVEVFGGWPSFDLDCSKVDHWRWRYLSKPGNEAHLWVVEAGGQVVGCLHYSPCKLKIGDGEHAGMLSGDIAVLEAYRGEGITARLSNTERALRKTSGELFSFFETRNKRLIRRYSRIAKILPYQTRHLLRVRRISQHLARKGHRWRWIKAPVYKLAQTAQWALLHRGQSKNESVVRISETQHFDQRFDRLWEQVSRHYSLIARRDRAFLEWRYGDSRGGSYRVFCAEDNNGLVGYAALRVNISAPAYPVGYILDLLCLPGREKAADSLLQKCLACCDDEKVNAINCLLPRGHPYFRLYQASGFVDSLERVSVFLNPTGIPEERLAEIDTFSSRQTYYAYGDIDTI